MEFYTLNATYSPFLRNANGRRSKSLAVRTFPRVLAIYDFKVWRKFMEGLTTYAHMVDMVLEYSQRWLCDETS